MSALLGKKIAHVVSTYPPYKGGMGNVAFAWVEELRRTGHTVDVFTPSTMRPWLRWGNAALCPQLLWRLRGYDVVHLHWPFIGGAEFVLLAKLFGIIRGTLVVTYHMDLVGGGFLGKFFHVYQALLIPLMLRVATSTTVGSLDYASHSARLSGKRTLVEVPYGVDGKRFQPVERGASTMTVLFVAALDRAHYFKGLAVLLNAWKTVSAALPHARLQIVGDGDRRAFYQDTVHALGIADQVEFLGAISGDRLPSIYQSAGLLAFPSVDASEAFGLVILEAAASGVPAIVSNLPGVRTLVVEGVTGFLVDPNNEHALAEKIIFALQDPDRQSQLRIAARARAEQYSWKASVEKLVAVYERVARQ